MSNSFGTSWTIAHQVPLSMGFLRQDYWNGLPFPSPGDLPEPGIKSTAPALGGKFFTTEPPGKTTTHLQVLFFFFNLYSNLHQILLAHSSVARRIFDPSQIITIN